jgi:hypothetical protein
MRMMVGGLQDHRVGPVLDSDVGPPVEHGGASSRICVISRNGRLQLEGGLGDVVGDHPPDVAAAVPATIGAVGFVDLRPDGGIGRGEPDLHGRRHRHGPLPLRRARRYQLPEGPR